MSSTKATSRELLSILRPLLPTLAVSIVLGIVGGLSVTALLARINALMHSEQAIASAVMLGFAGLCALALGCAIAANIGTNYVGQQVIARLRISLGGKVLCAPIEQLERYRSHRLIPVLTHDIDTVSDFTFGLPQLIVSLTVTLGCLGYLAMLDGMLFLITASVGAWLHRPVRGAQPWHGRLRSRPRRRRPVAEVLPQHGRGRQGTAHAPPAPAHAVPRAGDSHRAAHRRTANPLGEHLPECQHLRLATVLHGHRLVPGPADLGCRSKTACSAASS